MLFITKVRGSNVFQGYYETIGFQIAAYCLSLLVLRRVQRLNEGAILLAIGILFFSGILTTRLSLLFHWSLHALMAGLFVGGLFATLRNLGNLKRAKRFGVSRLRLPCMKDVVLLSFVTPFGEELFYRASLQSTLQHLLPSHWAIIVPSLLFTIHHVAFLKGELILGRYAIPFPLLVNALLPFGFSLSVGLLYSHFESLLAIYLAHVVVNFSVLLISASLRASIRTRFAPST